MSGIPQSTSLLLGPNFEVTAGRYVVPIFRDIDGAPESIGTGFLLNDGKVDYLVSAAHVLDHISSGEQLYYYSGVAQKRAIAGKGLLSKVPVGQTRQQDRIDVGVVILEMKDYLHIQK